MNTLSLVEFLLKNGSPRFKLEINEDLFFIKKLRNFYDQNDEEDLARSIQTIVQRILLLLENADELKAAKEEAKRLRNRIQGFSNEGESGSGNGSVDSKYQGISSDSYQNEGFSGNREINLAQKLGLESKVKPEETEVKKEKPVIASSQEAEIDFLGFSASNSNSAKLNSGEPDFLNTGQAKGKGTLKFLPPPPKKNQNNTTLFQGKANESQNTPKVSKETTLDLDFQALDISGNNPSFNSAPNSNLDQISESLNFTKPVPNNKGLMDFDFSGPSNLPKVPNSQPAQDFDFGFAETTTKNTPVQQNELDMFDFATSAKDTIGFERSSSVEVKGKSISKLPVPPKKNVLPTKESSDFLF